jgi:uncharacterized protein (DUF58 family)
MNSRFLDPTILATLGNLELVAKSVVDGFVSGLHRSPDFGFSQEFAEYRQYVPGDDLRHVDWNVYARSDRTYLKKFEGETNSQLTILVDCSKSMSYGSVMAASGGGSGGKLVDKLEYSRYLAASLCYLAQQQRDASGVLTFSDDVKAFVAPSSRQGQLHRILYALEHAETGERTNFEKPFLHILNLIHRRGVVVLISDCYGDPEQILKTIAPLRFRGSDVILFHVLDPHELEPPVSSSTTVIDMEEGERVEVSAAHVRANYKQRLQQHIESLTEECRKQNVDYLQLATGQSLDRALHEYLTIRRRRH